VSSKILLVDDDERGFIEGGVEVLGHMGFDVFAEINGDNAINRIYKDRPQVVVLDIKLPCSGQEGLTKGLSICNDIKEQQKQGAIDPALRIILVSGEYVEDSGQILGLRLGAHAYLNKPISFDLLAAHINTQLEESDILYFLAFHADEAKTKREIFKEVWGHTDVDESNLVACIAELRILLDDSNKKRFIKTRPRYGYIFVSPKE